MYSYYIYVYFMNQSYVFIIMKIPQTKISK
jgi:hypothetical protein